MNKWKRLSYLLSFCLRYGKFLEVHYLQTNKAEALFTLQGVTSSVSHLLLDFCHSFGQAFKIHNIIILELNMEIIFFLKLLSWAKVVSLFLSIVADKWNLDHSNKTQRVIKFNGQVYTFEKWILGILKEMQKVSI